MDLLVHPVAERLHRSGRGCSNDWIAAVGLLDPVLVAKGGDTGGIAEQFIGAPVPTGAVVRWDQAGAVVSLNPIGIAACARANRSGLLSYGVFPRIQRFPAINGGFSTG